MPDLLLTIATPAAPAPGHGFDLLEYGPVGLFAVVLLVVLARLEKMYERRSDADGKRVEAQLAQVQKIADTQAETAKAQTSTVNALSLVTAKMDDLVRDLRASAAERGS